MILHGTRNISSTTFLTSNLWKSSTNAPLMMISWLQGSIQNYTKPWGGPSHTSEWPIWSQVDARKSGTHLKVMVLSLWCLTPIFPVYFPLKLFECCIVEMRACFGLSEEQVSSQHDTVVKTFLKNHWHLIDEDGDNRNELKSLKSLCFFEIQTDSWIMGIWSPFHVIERTGEISAEIQRNFLPQFFNQKCLILNYYLNWSMQLY